MGKTIKFKNFEEREETGYVRAYGRGRTISSFSKNNRDYKIIIADTSGYNYYGYSFAAILYEVDNSYTRREISRINSYNAYYSEEKNVGGSLGAFGSVFKKSEIETLKNSIQ